MYKEVLCGFIVSSSPKMFSKFFARLLLKAFTNQYDYSLKVDEYWQHWHDNKRLISNNTMQVTEIINDLNECPLF